MADTTSSQGGADTLAPTQRVPTQTSTAEPPPTIILGAADETAIRPFSFHATDEDLADLKMRIAATRWPEPRAGKRRYSRRAARDDPEACRLLARPTRLAEGRGEDQLISELRHQYRRHRHPLHPREIEAPNALPIIVTHGWPGSIIEQLKIIEPLTDPTAHGGTEADAFDVVIPSMPGYGFSGKPTTTGWGPERIATRLGELMNRLGYTRYVAQGGDWGAQIVDYHGGAGAARIGRHQHQYGRSDPARRSTRRRLAGAPAPDGLDEEERQSFDHVSFFYKHGLGYAQRDGEPAADAVRH